ncbi:hypothetical protein DEU56DRAFT_6930 [Suillus clintonianus]|uniref:uncharacterized protein n=1 Tax=Suillus clintonianus TaxID=1904413 RepID=UPI001B88713B|nr:uncharacterized protein DEU56DRAFT_6930 [Suillus clintonianus]KAG2157165.1 hypothetical protein DEU56DRAFT_6930 [Suillus clintonianus]
MVGSGSCFLARAQILTVLGVLKRLFDAIGSSWTRFSAADSVSAFIWRFLGALHALLQSSAWYSSRKDVRDSEAQSLDLDLKKSWADTEYPLKLDLSDIRSSHLEAPSIKWLIETSRDPAVSLAAVNLVPQVEWPLDLDVSYMLHQLYAIYTSCLDVQMQIVPSLEERGSACTMALSHIYYGRVLQVYPDHGDLLGQWSQDGQLRRDSDVFTAMRHRRGFQDYVLTPTIKLSFAEDHDRSTSWSTPDLGNCPDSVSKWLSHVLPYHFVTGRVDKDIEKLSLAVISKLISPSSPSRQIIANCTLLACVMVGVQFDKKDIIRLDKSSALPKLAVSLLVQFQKALLVCDGGDLDRDSTGVGRRAWYLLKVICRILELARPENILPFRPVFGRNLDLCRKISPRARSFEQNDPSDSAAAFRRLLHFTLATAYQVYEPTPWFPVQRVGNSCSPEDFDWLVDYLDYIYSEDHDTAGDILLLLSGIKVSCSPAKLYLFIERLATCMGSNMPFRLRHAALRAAHTARDVLASIDAIDDARLTKMVLTKFSPAVMTTICPRPGAIPVNDGPRRLYQTRDLFYLELVFALAGSSSWRPHLLGDRHIEQCISMTAKSFSSHAFYLVGILLRLAPEPLSVSLLEPIAEQQWWDMIIRAWLYIHLIFDDVHCFEFFPILVEGTKKCMQIASKPELEQLIGNVDCVIETLEKRGSEQGQGEGVAVAAKELKTVVSDILERLSHDQ